MKLAVVGKTGTGKTTISALVAQEFVRRGRSVLAVDTDPYPNLGVSLGLDAEVVRAASAVPRGLASGVAGPYMVTTAELVAQYGLATPSGVTVLHAMRAELPGQRCFCLGHASPGSVLVAALEDEADVAVVDVEEGLEHLSADHGTLSRTDCLLVVMESTRKSVLSAGRTVAVAQTLGVPWMAAVGNKARLADDGEFFASEAAAHEVPLAGVVPYDTEVVEADRAGRLVTSASSGLRDAVGAIVDMVTTGRGAR